MSALRWIVSALGCACPPFGQACPLLRPILMAAISSSPDELDLPAVGSSYLEYLHSIPVGAKMRVELSAEPPGTLSEDDELELFFTVTKVGDDGWKGLKGAADDVVSTTVELYAHVRAVLAEDDEDVIRVVHGRDPLKVKREMVEQGAAEQKIIFHTLTEVIELDSETELEDDAAAGVGEVAAAGIRRHDTA